MAPRETERDRDAEETDVEQWRERLNKRANDGGGCLETAQAAAYERKESRRGVDRDCLLTRHVKRLGSPIKALKLEGSI